MDHAQQPDHQPPLPVSPGREYSSHLCDVNIRSAATMREYELIVSRVAAEDPGLVLDWGCGLGQIADMLRSRGVEVTAFDYQSDLAADGLYALERYPDIPVHLSSDPVRLPFPDNAFDTVLSIGVLEHVADKRGSLGEVRRVLRPGGTFYVYKLPNRHSYIEWIAKRVGAYYHGAAPHDQVFTLASAVQLVRDAGFEVLESRRANMLPLNRIGAAVPSLAGLWWRLNRLLERVPLLNHLSTNVDLLARKPATKG